MADRRYVSWEESEARAATPSTFVEIFHEASRAMANAYAADLNREFLYGDGSPAAPIPTAPLRVRLRWRVRMARNKVERRISVARWRYVLAPRERVARRIAPWLMDEEEARERYGDW